MTESCSIIIIPNVLSSGYCHMLCGLLVKCVITMSGEEAGQVTRDNGNYMHRLARCVF